MPRIPRSRAGSWMNPGAYRCIVKTEDFWIKGARASAPPVFLSRADVASATHARGRGAAALELLGSTRVAISLLVSICVASLIGTVLPPNQGARSCVGEFGPFWSAVFDQCSIW